MQKNRPNQVLRAVWRASIAFLLGMFAIGDTRGDELSRYEASHRAMGTLFTIVLYAPSDEVARSGFETAFRRIVELDKALNDYDPRSELSRLSAGSPTKDPVPVSDDLWRVLVESQKYHRASGGAFDVTVGPLTTLWRQARRTRQLPVGDVLSEARDAVGFQHVELFEQQQAVALRHANMRLDLGGIAKGFAVDEALAELRKHKIDSALVNGGGDMAASAAPPGRAGWKIGIAPLERDGKPSLFLMLKNQAVATSGDTWQFVEIDGVRYSHIVDPKTGLGLTQRGSVTVVAANCTAADALASAVSVLGPDQGLKLIDTVSDSEATVIREIDGKVVQQSSSGFSKLPTASDAEPSSSGERGALAP